MKAFKASLFGFGALMALTMMSCDPKTAPVELTASGLNPAKFDTVVNGDTVRLYTLKGDKGMEVCITNYGARIVSMMVPDKNDSLVDVVLGFDNIAQYMEKTTDYGSSVGRYANRINMGRFVLNGDTIQLKQNDKHDGRDHCLHGGGDTGWMNQIYKAEQIDDQTLKLTIVAEDGENGFPGTVTATTTYKIVNGNTLDITWEATTDKPTIINQTNHNYYNLSGDFEEPAGGLNQWLSVNADSFTVADDSYMPTGEIRAVEGTTMDLRTEHAIIDGLDPRATTHRLLLRSTAPRPVSSWRCSPTSLAYRFTLATSRASRARRMWFASLASTILSTSLYVWRARSIPTVPTILSGPAPC